MAKRLVGTKRCHEDNIGTLSSPQKKAKTEHKGTHGGTVEKQRIFVIEVADGCGGQRIVETYLACSKEDVYKSMLRDFQTVRQPKADPQSVRSMFEQMGYHYICPLFSTLETRVPLSPVLEQLVRRCFEAREDDELEPDLSACDDPFNVFKSYPNMRKVCPEGTGGSYGSYDGSGGSSMVSECLELYCRIHKLYAHAVTVKDVAFVFEEMVCGGYVADGAQLRELQYKRV